MAKGKKTKPSYSSAPQSPVRDIMDIKSLSDYLGMGKSKIYALIRQKKIPASRIGRHYRFSKVVVDQWLNEKLITRGAETQMTFFKMERNVP